MNPRHRARRCLALLLCSLWLISCQTSDDAAAAAKQLATTSADLANYYVALSQFVTADIALSDLQSSLQGVPFSDADRAIMSTTASELQKRADLAKSLQGLSATFSNLTGSTSPADVSNAASKLATELTTLKALPQPSGNPVPMPSEIGDASKLIVSLIQEHEEKKIAPALDATGNALKVLFSKEADTYDSLNKTYLTLAATLAKYCIDNNLVDSTSVLAPALQPFNLTAHPSLASSAMPLNTAAKNQVDETNKALVAAHHAASDAMLQAIIEMSTRIHQLAAEGRMPLRGTPVTLTTVEKWINTTSTYLPSVSTNASTATTSTASKPVKK